jgi:hypothetical protein
MTRSTDGYFSLPSIAAECRAPRRTKSGDPDRVLGRSVGGVSPHASFRASHLVDRLVSCAGAVPPGQVVALGSANTGRTRSRGDWRTVPDRRSVRHVVRWMLTDRWPGSIQFSTACKCSRAPEPGPLVGSDGQPRSGREGDRRDPGDDVAQREPTGCERSGAADRAVETTIGVRSGARFEIRPQLVDHFKLSTDPLFIEKLCAVVGST